MTNTTPIRQPPAEDILNALQLAKLWGATYPLDAGVEHAEDAANAFADVARLLEHAISQLGEPSLEAVQAAEVMLREWEGSRDPRNVRDVAAVILHAAMTGIVPPTWGERELPDPEFPEYICPKCGEPHVWHGRDEAERVCVQCRNPEQEAF